MKIVSIPCRSDNYAYLLICEQSQKAAVIDPSEAEPVLRAIEKEGVTLSAIWNTHHHYDHVGGNEEVLARFPNAAVVAHESDRGRVPGQTVFAKEGDVIDAGGELQASVIFNPGHTSGAISFYLAAQKALFTGDTLFAAGCGRLFEGTPAEMFSSLTKLTALPADTKVFCGHEYTLSNLRFAAAVEPESQAIKERANKVQAQRDAGEPSMGFSIAEELATNVFVRVDQAGVIAAACAEGAGDKEAVAVFAALRGWKDRF